MRKFIRATIIFVLAVIGGMALKELFSWSGIGTAAAISIAIYEFFIVKD